MSGPSDGAKAQSFRSPTPNTAPAASTRSPGELWVNFADKQLGAVDNAGVAQPLLAARVFSTQTNYVLGDHVVQAGTMYRALGPITPGAFDVTKWQIAGGAVSMGDTPPANPQQGNLWFDGVGAQLYIWFGDGSSNQWVIANNQGLPSNIVIDAPNDSTVYGRVNKAWSPVLPTAGGTMGGALVLAADPAQPLEASTKRYSDTKLALAGGTLTGLLTLSGPPTVALHASTKAYADTKLALGGGTHWRSYAGGGPCSASPKRPEQYVDAALASANAHADAVAPIGHIVMWVGTTAPSGWLLCDGSVYPIANIPAARALARQSLPRR